MGAIDDFFVELRAWLDTEDYGDPLLTSFVRIAESDISDTIRVRESIVDGMFTVAGGSFDLPDDFIEPHLTIKENGRPLDYSEESKYFALERQNSAQVKTKFTWIGSKMYVGGGALDGQDVQMWYYSRVPPLGEASTWLKDKYYTALLAYSLAAAHAYDVDEERAAIHQATGTAKIEAANLAHKLARTGGGPLNVRARSFG